MVRYSIHHTYLRPRMFPIRSQWLKLTILPAHFGEFGAAQLS